MGTYSYSSKSALVRVVVVLGLAAGDASATDFNLQPGIHPRVLFLPTDVQPLREKIQKTGVAPFYAALVSNARKLTTDSGVIATITRLEASPSYSDFGQNNGPLDSKLSNYQIQLLGEAMVNAAFAALMEGNTEYVASAKRAFLAFLMLKWDASNNANLSYPDFFRNAPYAAYAYDFIYTNLTESERNLYRSWAATQVAIASQDLSGNPSYGWASGFDPKKLNFNWVPIYNGMVKVLTASTEGEMGYDSLAAANASRALIAYLDSALPQKLGTPAMFKESLHYTGHGLVHGAPAYRAMSIRGDSVWSHPAWQGLTDYLLYDMKPWGRGEYGSFSATPMNTPGSVPMHLALVQHFGGSPKNQYIYQEVRKGGILGGCGNEYYACLLNVLWSPEAPVSVNLPSLGLAQEIHFERNGWVYASSSWDPQATKFWFISENEHLGRSHAHGDRLQVGIESKGRIFTTDPGFGVNYGRDHGHVKIDGIGQNYFVHKGKITFFGKTLGSGFQGSSLSDRDPVTVTGDAKLAYDYLALGESTNCTGWSFEGFSFPLLIEGYCSRSYNPVRKANRTIDFIRKPQPYMVISDDIRKDDLVRTYTSEHMIPMGLRLESVNAQKAYLRPFYSGKYVSSVAGGDFRFQVSVPTQGVYFVWVLAEKNTSDPSNYGIQKIQIDGASPKGNNGSGNNSSMQLRDGDNSRFHYQKLLTQGEALSAGVHEFLLGWPQSSVRMARLILTQDPSLNPNFSAIPPTSSIVVNLYDQALPSGWSIRDSSLSDPSLLLYMVSEGSEISGFKLEKHLVSKTTSLTHILGNTPQICTDEPACVMQKLSYSVKSIEPKFMMLAYPHTPSDPIPDVSSSGTSLRVLWADGTRDDWGTPMDTEPPAPINTPPSITIISPTNGMTYTHGTSVTFSGNALDEQDGSLSSQIRWYSNLQGHLGTGASITRSDLIIGTHSISAIVSDSKGASSTATTSVNIKRSTKGGGKGGPRK